MFPNGIQKGPTKNVELAKGNDVLLVYAGNLSMSGKNGVVNISIGVHIEIDSSVGVRYEVVYERGNNVMTHTALFYKFSSPTQSVFYDYRTHESTISNCCGSSGDPKISVIGTEVVDTFPCTHLQHASNGGAENYWVSKKIPGYQKLTNVLNNISATPGLQGLALNGTIFRWGGLVRMNGSHTDPKKLGSVSVNLNLIEVNPAMSFPESDFDVPTQ